MHKTTHKVGICFMCLVLSNVVSVKSFFLHDICENFSNVSMRQFDTALNHSFASIVFGSGIS